MILKLLQGQALSQARWQVRVRVRVLPVTTASRPHTVRRYFSGSAGASTVAGLEIPVELSGDSAPRYPNLLALPVVSQPIFPSRPKVIILRDQATIAALEKVAYVGVFLRKRYPKGITEGGIILDKPEIITDLSDLYSVGTFCKLQKINASPDTHDTRDEPVYVDDSETEASSTTPHAYWLMGKRRINLTSIDSVGPPIDVTVSHWDRQDYVNNDTIRALSSELLSMTRELSKESPSFRESMSWFPSRMDASDPFRLADFCASIVTHGSPEDLQAVLEEQDAEMRLHLAMLLLIKDREVAKVQQEIAAKIGQANSESHRKHFLRQQLDVIKGMLGVDQKDKEVFLTTLRKQLSEWPLVPTDVQHVIEKEMERFDSMEASSSEYMVSRTYLDWLCSLPWGKMSPDNFDLHAAREILDSDHYGMDDVKDTILQFIAVGKLKGSVHGKIICLVGPPGVGKTSVAKSIARALGREFFRFSVGGLTDTSEVRGHRRTYVGAMPGKLIQGLKLAGSMNPLVLIDEIDKIGQGVRGNPGHALLEVLDPNQNSSFVDQYLDVPVDMSNVLFVCTANTLETIPGPLMDRMEIFQLSGYDSPEKVAIAEQYLIPKSMSESGLMIKHEEVTAGEESEKDVAEVENGSPAALYKRAESVPESLAIDKSAVEMLVRWYAREAGVRTLANYIDKITRKLALQLVAEGEGTKLNEKSSRKSDSWNVTEDNVAEYVGKPIFTSDRMYEKDPLPNGKLLFPSACFACTIDVAYSSFPTRYCHGTGVHAHGGLCIVH